MVNVSKAEKRDQEMVRGDDRERIVQGPLLSTGTTSMIQAFLAAMAGPMVLLSAAMTAPSAYKHRNENGRAKDHSALKADWAAIGDDFTRAMGGQERRDR